jgi:tetrahydromethanopterin S-methyltransferase subunit G
MARMIAEVYDALRSAGADENKARAAATSAAGQWEIEARLDQIDKRIDKVESRLERLEPRVGKVETDLAVLKWMIGANIGLTIMVLGKLPTLN